MPGSGISSELSSHPMAQSAGSGSVSVPPSIPDSLVLYWTLVGQAVIPSGFEDAFMGFSEAWTEAAARYDHRKSSWNNESAAVTPAAQKRAREDKVRLEKHSKDQFLLTAFRTRLQKIMYEGATARKDAEEDERSRWLHILAGIVQNTETPMARLLREKPGNVLLLGAGKRATTFRAGSCLCVGTPCGSQQRMESLSRVRSRILWITKLLKTITNRTFFVFESIKTVITVIDTGRYWFLN